MSRPFWAGFFRILRVSMPIVLAHSAASVLLVLVDAGHRWWWALMFATTVTVVAVQRSDMLRQRKEGG